MLLRMVSSLTDIVQGLCVTRGILKNGRLEMDDLNGSDHVG